MGKFKLGSVEAAARVPMDAPVGRWAMTALKSSTAPVRMGNFVTGTQTVYSLLVTKYPR